MVGSIQVAGKVGEWIEAETEEEEKEICALLKRVRLDHYIVGLEYEN